LEDQVATNRGGPVIGHGRPLREPHLEASIQKPLLDGNVAREGERPSISVQK
jgi:hypothetical protein